MTWHQKVDATDDAIRRTTSEASATYTAVTDISMPSSPDMLSCDSTSKAPNFLSDVDKFEPLPDSLQALPDLHSPLLRPGLIVPFANAHEDASNPIGGCVKTHQTSFNVKSKAGTEEGRNDYNPHPPSGEVHQAPLCPRGPWRYHYDPEGSLPTYASLLHAGADAVSLSATPRREMAAASKRSSIVGPITSLCMFICRARQDLNLY